MAEKIKNTGPRTDDEMDNEVAAIARAERAGLPEKPSRLVNDQITLALRSIIRIEGRVGRKTKNLRPTETYRDPV